jgi:small subunit ribosomal protein S18
VAREKTPSNTQRRRPGGPAGQIRRRNCFFCKEKIAEIDYKNINQLRRYISERGKIRSRRITGACRRHQVQVAQAVKRAREMALLPYVAEGPDDNAGGRGGRRDRGDRGDRGDR